MSNPKSGARRGHRVIVILLLLVILLLAAISCGLALRLYRRSDPLVVGSWRMGLALEELARERANAWLHAAALGDQVDAGSYLPRLEATITLRLDENGSWSRSADASSLAEAKRQAENALARALRDLMCLRVAEAGRPRETPEAAQRRMEQVLGMSLEEYLSDYGPALLPTEEELRAQWDGSGTYQVEGATLALNGATPARYLADDLLLVLAGTEGTEVYTRAR